VQDIILPNIRKLFIPDPGFVIMEADLAGADAQVVAWEADDEDLKAAFRAGLDVHSKNAEDMWGSAFTRLTGLARHKKRQSCKHAVHGTDYIASPSAIAHHPSINWTIHEAEQFQRRWFQLHPKIKGWHISKRNELETTRTITNPLGYRRVYFDRIDACLPEAVAWSPQSTVALVSFFGAIQLERNFMQPTPIVDLNETPNPCCHILLQNHDSVVFQVPKRLANRGAEIRRLMEYEIPFADPLTIRLGLKMSDKSWGDAKESTEVV
jgi:DNA polymerase-1